MQITLHPCWIALLMLFSFTIGYIILKAQVGILKKQIIDLEKEKMFDHAEILQLQKSLSSIQSNKQSMVSTPVVPIKDKDSGQTETVKNFRANP